MPFSRYHSFFSFSSFGAVRLSLRTFSTGPDYVQNVAPLNTLTSHRNFRAGMHGKDAAKPWMAHLHRFRPSPIPHTRVFRSAVLGHRNRPVETVHSPYTHPRTTKQPQSNNLNKTRKTKKTDIYQSYIHSLYVLHISLRWHYPNQVSGQSNHPA